MDEYCSFERVMNYNPTVNKDWVRCFVKSICIRSYTNLTPTP